MASDSAMSASGRHSPIVLVSLRATQTSSMAAGTVKACSRFMTRFLSSRGARRLPRAECGSQRVAQRRGALGADALAQAELRGLLAAAVGVTHAAQLAGEPDLPETGDRRAALLAAEGDPLRRAGHRKSHREVGAGLVDAHAADDIDEDVGGPHADPAVAAQHREDEREAVAVDARAH